MLLGGTVLSSPPPIIPRPAVDKTDIEAYDRITEVPWLLNSIHLTGNRWGNRISNVTFSSLLPKYLLGIALLEDEKTIRLVFWRWDRYEYMGWDEDFSLALRFADGNQVEITVPSSSRLVDGHSLLLDCEDHVIAERQPQKGRVIPRVLWNVSQAVEKRTSHTIRRLIRNVRSINNLVQCSSLYVIANDETCRQEILNSGIPNLAEAYDTIVAGSYKADLARYYMLYRYGGVYTDDKCTLRHSLDSEAFDNIIADHDMFIGIIGESRGEPEIAFMGARAGSPIILKALEYSVRNIMNRYYGETTLAITGNRMMREVITAGVEDKERRNLMRQPPPSEKGLGIKRVKCWGDNLALLRIDHSDETVYYGEELVWHRQSIPWHDWPRTKGYYGNLWVNRIAYVDGNPPQPLTFWVYSILTNYENGVATTLLLFLGIGLLGIIAYILHRNPSLNII